MIPKKLIFIAILIFAGAAYFLKGQSLRNLQSPDLQREMIRKEKVKELNAKGLQNVTKKELDAMVNAELTGQKVEDPRKSGNKFLKDQCVTNREDGWEFTKILDVMEMERSYRIIDCHKYKGCTEPKVFPFHEIEFEYRTGRIITCSR